jgi:CRP/FNR family transcriptional regulator
VYCVRGGAVKMVHIEPSGVARIVRVLKLGDVAGLESVFREKYDYSAIAVDTVRACRIPDDAISASSSKATAICRCA